jgi:threonine aldolase
MGNAVSTLAHTNRGDSFICEAGSHLYTQERGFWATLGSLYPKLIPGEDGYLPVDAVRRAAGRPRPRGTPRTSLLCLENTHRARVRVSEYL